MLSFPPGFDLSTLVADYTSIALFFLVPIVCLAAYGLYRKIIGKL